MFCILHIVDNMQYIEDSVKIQTLPQTRLSLSL